METETTLNADQPLARRWVNRVNAARLAALLVMLAFVFMAVTIMLSDPMRSTEGYFIRSIEPGSPADIAGVSGILTHINGKPVPGRNELSDLVYSNLGKTML